MTHVVLVTVKRFYKVYVEDDREGFIDEDEIITRARLQIEEKELDALAEDDTPFELEDVENMEYGYFILD